MAAGGHDHPLDALLRPGAEDDLAVGPLEDRLLGNQQHVALERHAGSSGGRDLPATFIASARRRR